MRAFFAARAPCAVTTTLRCGKRVPVSLYRLAHAPRNADTAADDTRAVLPFMTFLPNFAFAAARNMHYMPYLTAFCCMPYGEP